MDLSMSKKVLQGLSEQIFINSDKRVQINQLLNCFIHQSFMVLNSMTVFNIDNYEMLSVISEGSCDSEDWSNDAYNTALTIPE